jgi:peptidoglycan/LPS O-acetylase OafA/YrhL
MRLSSTAVTAGVASLAVTVLGLGLWMLVAPGSFYDALGPFGPRNDHYTRDVSTWHLAFGGALAVAVRRRSWRVPLLALALAQFALHAVNHVVDAGEADPAWVGTFDAVALVLGAVLLLGLLRAAREAEVAGTAARREVVG